MAKGLSVATGITVAGLLGALVFTAGIMPGVMNLLGQGGTIGANDDFTEFADKLNDVCNGDAGEDSNQNQASGGVSLYDGSIEFSDQHTAVLIEDAEMTQEREIDCSVNNHEQIAISGTATYTITLQNGNLVVQVEGV